MLKANKVVLDGFTLHSACVGNVLASDFIQLNSFSRESLSSLIQGLIVHDQLLVGKDVIGPSSRFPDLFRSFGDALAEKATVPLDANSPLAQQYLALKARFAELKRDLPYEEELTEFVQRNFFESGAELDDSKLMNLDSEIFPILLEHSKLRARMYINEAHEANLAYVPSPYRQRQLADSELLRSVAMDLVSKVDQEVRTPLMSKLLEAGLVEAGELQIPPLVHFVLEMSQNVGILDTAAQLRRSKEASDFRTLCREYWEAAASNDILLKAKVLAELEQAKQIWFQRLRMAEVAPLKVRMSLGVIGSEFPFKAPPRLFEPLKMRPGYVFLFNIAKALYRPKIDPSKPTPGKHLHAPKKRIWFRAWRKQST